MESNLHTVFQNLYPKNLFLKNILRDDSLFNLKKNNAKNVIGKS